MNTPTIALRQDLQVKEVAVKDVDMNEGGVPPVRGRAEGPLVPDHVTNRDVVRLPGVFIGIDGSEDRFADRHILPLPLPLRDLCFCVCRSRIWTLVCAMRVHVVQRQRRSIGPQLISK